MGANHTPLAGAHGVHKRYGRIEALKGVDLDLHPGELLALLGPNGAGKTTLISLLLGLRRPDRGEVRLFGLNPRDLRARSAVGATPQQTAFPNNLTVLEVMELIRAHYPQPRPIRGLLEAFELDGLERRQVGGLSDGQKRRLAVALAFSGDPKAVFLDEPTTGLDVKSRRGIWEGIQAFRQSGGAVLLTTHYLEEAETLASRVIILHHGQVIAEGSVAELKQKSRGERLEEVFLALTEAETGGNQ